MRRRIITHRAAISGIVAVLILAWPGVVSADVMDAAKRARAGDFSVAGEVACAQEVGQSLGVCLASVAMDDATGSAVVVEFPNGFARTLLFEDGAFLRGNTTMSGNGTDIDWHVENGTHLIRVDDQRFEIPEGLILGK